MNVFFKDQHESRAQGCILDFVVIGPIENRHVMDKN